MEDQEDWLVLLGSDGILDMLLVLGEELWVKLDVAGLVDTVNVSEASGNGKVWGDWGKSLVDGKNVLGLGVQRVVVNILVVNSILLTTGDTDFLETVSALFGTFGFKDLPSRAIASWGQRALGMRQWSRCCTQPTLHSDRSCGWRREARHAP